MADAPAVLPLPSVGQKRFRVLHVSDIHVDLLYNEGASTDCPYVVCCRTDLGTTSDPSKMAGYWGSAAKCDPPKRTVEAFLKQVATMDIDLVLWTGDNASTDYWLYNRETHLKNSQEITDLITKYLPNTPVYPIMGNHETYPQDQFHLVNEQWLTNGLADMWAHWLTPEATTTFAENAYYTMKDTHTGLRILGINTMMCDTLNFWLMLNATDPGNHLEWLRQQLHKAESDNELVFIIGHIPIGDPFCMSTWATVYRAIVNRFRNIIRGQFFGHTHTDDFQVVSSLDYSKPPAGVLYVVPSFSTFEGHDPAFRVFELDADTLQIVDYDSYRLDMARANLDRSTFPTFHKAYSARSEYDLPDLSPASWEALSQSIYQRNETLIEKFRFNKLNKDIGKCDSTLSIGRNLLEGTLVRDDNDRVR